MDQPSLQGACLGLHYNETSRALVNILANICSAKTMRMPQVGKRMVQCGESNVHQPDVFHRSAVDLTIEYYFYLRS